MDYVDHASTRVCMCALTGIAAGSAYSTMTGLPLKATCIKIGGSFALVGTALFGAERLAYAAFKDQLNNEQQLVLTSHAFSGIFGGGLNGYLFQKKIMRGMVCFLPAMVAVAFLELAWEDHIQTRRKELNMAHDS